MNLLVGCRPLLERYLYYWSRSGNCALSETQEKPASLASEILSCAVTCQHVFVEELL